MPGSSGRDYISKDDYPPNSLLGRRAQPDELPAEPPTVAPSDPEAVHPAWTVAGLAVALAVAAGVLTVILFSPQGWRWGVALAFLAVMGFLWGKGPKEQPGFTATWFFVAVMIILGVLGLDLLPR